MSQQEINFNKQIFYEKNARFEIIQNVDENSGSETIDISENLADSFMTNDIVDEFNNFFNKHSGDESTETPETHLFFWKLCCNTIVVNDEIDAVDNDIFNQIVMFAYWFFERGYRIKGSFFYRMGRIIEFISMDGITKFITHHMLMDNDNIEHFYRINYCNDDICEEILEDAKNKITQYIKKNNFSDENQERIAYSVIIENVENKQNQLIMDSVLNRLTVVENKVKSLVKVNKVFWKLFTVTGIIAIGSILMYAVKNNENNYTTNNNCTITTY